MATTASMHQAEAYLKSREGQGDPVTLARRRALELRAEAGEATLKLSERASDSADSVLRAASLLQDLSETLHVVQSDMRLTRVQLEQLLEQAGASLSSVKTSKTNGTLRDTLNSSQLLRPDEENISKKDKQRDRAYEFFESWYQRSLRDVSFAAASSSEWDVCLIRAAQTVHQSLSKCAEEAAMKGWIGRFPSFSVRLMRSFVENQLLFLCLFSSWSGRENAQGEILTEEQWHRLARGLSETFAKMEGFEYLLLTVLEPNLHLLVVKLFQHAKQEAFVADLDNLSIHPMRRALIRVTPCLASHRMVCDSIAPLVIMRLTIFLQENKVAELKTMLREDLAPLGLTLN